ncbi:multiple inositol polyphosphate phosphatase 1 [Apis mellifera caucasica]|uniref:Multiple inositol polyphosphate phosphatase 1 n=1 Tax=Apis mellifera TaxID=7460 RepID=A0A7M7G9X0_APIME|nr:multiple inositol polyphosphate phosphatase 1 [Apis mellifera]XP_016771651.1 multiple inositol polyphosphate phosphatase 1 [Apis mellifera]KAG6797882.1 multiple inositol polyphosphate phosphatase 1 [Apis mellifera caucasica]KAG9429736.1 multiple inositol polyphosphate phosphatase 1 [Apis mellifera carnica]|eukprot:XP_003249384.1 multiple inositol polyphosphate phosphatase 1 [Apis mellifera]
MQSDKIILIATLIAILCLEGHLIVGEYCYADDPNPYLLFGIRTAYKNVRGTITDSMIPNCEPLQIWMLLKHGSISPPKYWSMRLKDDNNMEIIKRDLAHSKAGRMCQKDYERIKHWNNYEYIDKTKVWILSKEGELGMMRLGQRLKTYFPELIQCRPVNTLKKQYYFRAMNAQRSIASMRSLIKGLFGNINLDNVDIRNTSHDKILQYHLTQREFFDYYNTRDLFIFNDEFRKMINGIRQRYDLSSDPAHFIYAFDQLLDANYVCMRETSWYPDVKSPWCAMFTKEELKFFAIYIDRYLYRSPPYFQKHTQAACPILKDLYIHFTNLEKGNVHEEPKGIFYFGDFHSLMFFYSLLGHLDGDAPMPLNFTLHDLRNRKYDLSYLIPYNGNVAAVFYKCSDGFKVKLYSNERPLNYKGCPHGTCEWGYFKKVLRNIALKCNVDLCNLP